MKNKVIVPVLFVLLALVMVNSAAAQREPIPPPMPPIWNMEALSIEYQRVDVEIEDQVTDEAVVQSLEAMMDPVRRRRMVEHNYELARGHYSLEAATPLLNELFSLV